MQIFNLSYCQEVNDPTEQFMISIKRKHNRKLGAKGMCFQVGRFIGAGARFGWVDWGVGKVVRYEGLGLGRGLRGKGPQVQDWNV